MVSKENPIICWWSGGITSAVACKLAIDLYGVDNCRVIFLDTKNEDEDTYRFMADCSKWYELEIESLTEIGRDYESIEDVWYRHKQLNTASGAICSYKLKRRVREKWEKDNKWSHQVFGFEFETKEFKRAMSLSLNHGHTKPIFPLLLHGLTKKDCIKYVEDAGLKIPRAYSWGYLNNNCLGSGCISGGIGYWAKLAQEKPELVDRMAKIEHDLTDQRGYPVTMLKDQSKEAKARVKESGDPRDALVFLKPHKDYPNHKSLKDMKGRPIKPLTDCNGFCGVDDLLPNKDNVGELNNLEGDL